MDLQEFLDHVNRGALIEGGSEAHAFMHAPPRRRCGSSPSSTARTARRTRCGPCCPG